MNRGIAKANKGLEKNGNPKAEFDVNKRTEFRVTIVSNGKSGTIKWHDEPKSGTISGESGTMNGESGTMKNDAGIAKNSEINAEYRQIKEKSGTMNGKSGTMNGESGTMDGESGTMDSSEAKLYDIESQDSAVFAVVANCPGIKRDQIFLRVQTSIRSVQRTLGRLAKEKKIEYRGSKQKGGWYVKT